MSAKIAVLGLLVEQPLHGYGIERLIEQRGMRKWTSIGFPSIVPVPDHVEAMFSYTRSRLVAAVTWLAELLPTLTPLPKEVSP